MPLYQTGITEREKGAPNGVAELDGAGKVLLSEMPFDGLNYQGAWVANANTPALADGVGTAGDFYRVSVAGTQDLGSGSQSFSVGDHVIYEGGIWQKVGSAAGSSTVDLGANYPWSGPHSHTLPIAFIASKNYEILSTNIATDDRFIIRSTNLLDSRLWLDSFAGTTGLSLAEIGVERAYFGTEIGTHNTVLDTKGFLLKLKTASAANFAIFDTSTLTADRTYQLPDASGTIALASDGAYAPTITPGANAANASATHDFIYLRVGNKVQFAGAINVTAQAAGPTLIDLSLPVNPNAVFTTTDQANGAATASTGGAMSSAYVRSDPNTNNAVIDWVAPNTQQHTIRFHAMYTIT